MHKSALVYNQRIYVFAFVVSILISFWIGYRDAVINPDGICYLLGAQLVGTASLHEVLHLCPQSSWPFYSTLIYAFAHLSHFSYPISAYVLNGLFSIISTLAFIMIVKEMGAKGRVLWLAALIILFDHQFNSLRITIIRDHGFWACYLISIYSLIRFFKQPTWVAAMAWSISLLLATLFRIEGAFFLIGLPFLIWINKDYSWRQRAKAFFMLNVSIVLIAFVLILWQFFHAQTAEKLGRVGEIFHHLRYGLSLLIDRYEASKAALVQYVLPPEGAADAGIVIFWVWIVWYLVNVGIALSWGYALLLLYACKTQTVKLTSSTSLVVWGYVGVNLIVTLGFLAEHLFVSLRYLIGLSLVLMLWLPFALDDLLLKWNSIRHRIFLIFVSLFIFSSALGGIVEFGHSKFYIRSAGLWVAQAVPKQSKLYVNDFQLMYYTNHFGMDIFKVLPTYIKPDALIHGQWKQYDYLALRLRHEESGVMAEVMQELKGIQPLQEFSNKRGNRVVIYKIPQQEK
jgi:hypothetical protein